MHKISPVCDESNGTGAMPAGCLALTRVAIYARISSPNQKYNYSIQEQISQCRIYIKQRGWSLRYIFFDEESGKTIERPKFKLMIEKAKQNLFDIVIVWKLDRFCRSLVDLVTIERVLREYRVGLISVTEFIDTTTSVGRFNFRSIGSVAELERELIGERARLGLHALAKQKKWPNNHPPLGYRKKNDGTLKITSERSLVSRIFYSYLKNPSLPEIVYELNKKGILTKQNKRWSAKGIWNILTNRLYIGQFSVAGFEQQVEEYRIISDNVFSKIQKLLSRYQIVGSKRPLMPTERKNDKIDEVFNQFFSSINPKSSEHTTKQVKSEKALMQHINNGWRLIGLKDNRFILAKDITQQ